VVAVVRAQVQTDYLVALVEVVEQILVQVEQHHHQDKVTQVEQVALSLVVMLLAVEVVLQPLVEMQHLLWLEMVVLVKNFLLVLVFIMVAVEAVVFPK
jgi:hypothetical protein